MRRILLILLVCGFAVNLVMPNQPAAYQLNDTEILMHNLEQGNEFSDVQQYVGPCEIGCYALAIACRAACGFDLICQTGCSNFLTACLIGCGFSDDPQE